VRALAVRSATLWLLAIRDVDTELKGRAVTAALMLRSYMNDRATCTPAVGTIARGIRVSGRTVQRGLSDLEAGGWLIRTPQGHHSGSHYQAALPQDVQLLARLRAKVSTRKDAAKLLGHLPISSAGVTSASPLLDPDLTSLSPLDFSGVTSTTSEVTRVSHKDLMKIYNPPPSPREDSELAGRGGGNPSMTPPAGSSATDPLPDDDRRPEDVTDQQWAAWQVDPLQPAGCTTYQWACFRRAIEAIAPHIGVEAHEAVLGAHWRAFQRGRELVVLMRQCADIDPDATGDAVVKRRCGQLPYTGADNIPAAMLARLRTLDRELRDRPPAPAWSARMPLAPEVEAHLFGFFGAADEDSNPF
jgi:hypothetical protein